MNYLDTALKVIKDLPKDKRDLNPDIFRDLFERAVSDVSNQYLPGTLDFIRKDLPDLYREMEKAEDRVNDLWIQARKKAISETAAHEAIGQWKNLHLKAIELFSSKPQ